MKKFPNHRIRKVRVLRHFIEDCTCLKEKLCIEFSDLSKLSSGQRFVPYKNK